MDALILAAGKGTRLGLNDSPKCLIEFGNSSLIEYQIKCLNELGIKNIHIITGYFPEKIKSKIGDLANYIHNPEFSSTNNICSIYVQKISCLMILFVFMEIYFLIKKYWRIVFLQKKILF